MSAVLKTPIVAEELRVVDPNFRAEHDDDKLGVLDVKVETPYGVIDVQIQVLPHVHLRKRVVYYTARMYVEQLGKGQNYGSLSRAITIMIANFILFNEDQVCHHRCIRHDTLPLCKFVQQTGRGPAHKSFNLKHIDSSGGHRKPALQTRCSDA